MGSPAAVVAFWAEMTTAAAEDKWEESLFKPSSSPVITTAESVSSEVSERPRSEESLKEAAGRSGAPGRPRR